jgi:type-F conjugative transfer system pilin assembly protein TrbC
VKRTSLLITLLYLIFCGSILGNDLESLILQAGNASQQVSKDATSLIETLGGETKNEFYPSSTMENSFYDPTYSDQGSKNPLKLSNPKKLLNAGKGACRSRSSSQEGKCGLNLPKHLKPELLKEGDATELTEIKGNPDVQVLIFVSQSMPKDSVRALWKEVQAIGGRIVFRGLIGDSFKETKDYISDLGVVADIDPNAFEEHQVKMVPTFVISSKDRNDKVVGHLSFKEVLEIFRKKGELNKEASQLYNVLKGKWS